MILLEWPAFPTGSLVSTALPCFVRQNSWKSLLGFVVRGLLRPNYDTLSPLSKKRRTPKTCRYSSRCSFDVVLHLVLVSMTF